MNRWQNAVALAEPGMERGELRSVVVVLPLVPYRQHQQSCRIHDFEEGTQPVALNGMTGAVVAGRRQISTARRWC